MHRKVGRDTFSLSLASVKPSTSIVLSLQFGTFAQRLLDAIPIYAHIRLLMLQGPLILIR